ncbi:hypothetical protein LCGC14_2339320 [marine sediment metagenome]|uniref:Uncharacterized protein n=1 Tax=marine sediment metagenome TaxID=412755 RepID=A0A0F9F7J8_9ZZZZ
MNWTVIGLLITLIVILFGLLSIAAYSIIRLADNAKMLMYNLNYYKDLANKYGLQLIRIEEITKEAENFYGSDIGHPYINELISNIKSLVKIVGR